MKFSKELAHAIIYSVVNYKDMDQQFEEELKDVYGISDISKKKCSQVFEEIDSYYEGNVDESIVVKLSDGSFWFYQKSSNSWSDHGDYNDDEFEITEVLLKEIKITELNQTLIAYSNDKGEVLAYTLRKCISQ